MVELAGAGYTPKGPNPFFFKMNSRGLTEENTRLCIISQIGYFQSLIENYYFSNLGLGICSLTLIYLTQKSPIPHWVYYPQLEISYPQSDIKQPIGDTFS